MHDHGLVLFNEECDDCGGVQDVGTTSGEHEPGEPMARDPPTPPRATSPASPPVPLAPAPRQLFDDAWRTWSRWTLRLPLCPRSRWTTAGRNYKSPFGNADRIGVIRRIQGSSLRISLLCPQRAAQQEVHQRVGGQRRSASCTSTSTGSSNLRRRCWLGGASMGRRALPQSMAWHLSRGFIGLARSAVEC